MRRKIDFEDAIDWDCPKAPALWRYNLHYFDYLRQRDMRVEQGLVIMRDWISHHENLQGIGWHPYPVSLRLVNWIYFVSSNVKAQSLRQNYVDSIALQAAWLLENIEYHILANHLFANAKALLFAGGFIGGALGERCLARGLDILRAELDEQFLDDGGHYERTPMYHTILTHDLLDLSNLFSSNPELFSSDDLDVVNGRARAALDFLNTMTPPDNSTLFFNDSTNAIAPERLQLMQFARRIMNFQAPVRPQGMSVTSLDSSGYYIVRDADNYLAIDCGAIGPDYQPGHAHCDMLSYEYFSDGQKRITNCGNYDYAPSKERRYARSTAAHNTVVIDEDEQSEIWGAFRVARRARPIHATLTRVSGDEARFEGAHDGYERLSRGLIHRRRITYHRGGAFCVEDSIDGVGEHTMDSYVHFVAGLTVRASGDAFDIVDENGAIVMKVTSLGADSVAIVPSERYPEFGLKMRGESLRLRKRAEAPFVCSYTITPGGALGGSKMC